MSLSTDYHKTLTLAANNNVSLTQVERMCHNCTYEITHLLPSCNCGKVQNMATYFTVNYDSF